MITLVSGLINSLIVLEFLRNEEELFDIPIDVGAFTNCREAGLTFKVMDTNCKGFKSFTWCVYEHRNSDSIIINGKEGYLSLSGDLPYKGKTKYEYIGEFKYNQHYEAAQELSKLIQKFWKENKEQKGKKR